MADLSLHVNLESASDVVQEFSDKLDKTMDLNNIKLPFTLKNKILMSPGKWNGMTYTQETITEAYNSTDFSDKTICGLYHDHLDGIDSDGNPTQLKVTDWIGDVTNAHMDGDTLRGDLNILDKQTAIKLAYGAKFGISPSVKGLADEQTNTMLKFRFNNYGMVVNPAIKTAYINNEEKIQDNSKITITEPKKDMGDTMAEPELPKKEELPVTPKVPVKEEPKVEDVPETKDEEKEMPIKKKEEMSMDYFKQEMSEIKSILSTLSEVIGVLKENSESKVEVKENSDDEIGTVTPEIKTEEPVVEMKQDVEVVKEMSEIKTEDDKQTAEPVRLTQELGETTTDAPVSTGDVDQDLVNFIKSNSK